MSDTRRCWRCGKGPVVCYGVPCPACRVVLENEYEMAKAANGGRLLHIPENFDMNKQTDEPTTNSRMCGECARDFTYAPRPGRPPTICPACREARDAAAPVRQKSAPVAKPVSTIVVQRASVPVVAELPAPPVNVATTKLDIPAIRQAIGEEIEELEEALSVRLRLQRAFDRYVAQLAS